MLIEHRDSYYPITHPLLFIAGIYQSLFVHENSVVPGPLSSSSTLISMSRTFSIQDGDPCNSLDCQLLYLPNNFTSNLLKMCVHAKLLQSCPTLRSHGLQPTRLLCPWNSPGKNTGVGCHFLLQNIFPIQGPNTSPLRLLHWQADSLPLEPSGKPLLKTPT